MFCFIVFRAAARVYPPLRVEGNAVVVRAARITDGGTERLGECELKDAQVGKRFFKNTRTVFFVIFDILKYISRYIFLRFIS